MAADMVDTLLEFRCRFNKLKGLDNWGSEDIDSTLTHVRNQEFIDQRTKKKEEVKLYAKTMPDWEKAVPVWSQLMKNPMLHKLVYVYSKPGSMGALKALLEGGVEGTKRLLAYLLSALKG